MLEIIDLTKKYDKSLAVDHLNLAVKSGEIGVLLGPNGAGKSTTIKCIAGLLRFKGKIRICGYGNKTLEAKRRLGYVPEMPVMYEYLTVREHLEFIARAYRVPDWQRSAEVLMERFELADKASKTGRELSKGMQQKVSVCCALLPKPELLLFDEPLVGLDPKAIKEIKTIFQELKAEGRTILVSTHILDTMENFWDRTMIMMNGHVAASRTKAEVDAQNESLEDLFFAITEGEKEETS